MTSWIIALSVLGIAAYLIYRIASKPPKWSKPGVALNKSQRDLLSQHVRFYQNLSAEKKLLFERKVGEFLANCTITGAGTEVTEIDRLLVASGAIIPILSFPEWRYVNLDEVLLYADRFNEEFATEGGDRPILGMVGTGYMERKMILSKPALHAGFNNDHDARNTAIHEFIHLIDKMDGNTDGVPKILLDQPYVIPWIHMMEKEYEALFREGSDINPYAQTNKAEFFAVLGEYFFERPQEMATHHPELYAALNRVFSTDDELR